MIKSGGGGNPQRQNDGSSISDSINIKTSLSENAAAAVLRWFLNEGR